MHTLGGAAVKSANTNMRDFTASDDRTGFPSSTHGEAELGGGRDGDRINHQRNRLSSGRFGRLMKFGDNTEEVSTGKASILIRIPSAEVTHLIPKARRSVMKADSAGGVGSQMDDTRLGKLVHGHEPRTVCGAVIDGERLIGGDDGVGACIDKRLRIVVMSCFRNRTGNDSSVRVRHDGVVAMIVEQRNGVLPIVVVLEANAHTRRGEADSIVLRTNLEDVNGYVLARVIANSSNHRCALDKKASRIMGLKNGRLSETVV